MIRTVATLLFLFTSASAFGLSADEFVTTYAKLGQLERADNAYALCEGALGAWPRADYQSTVQRLGQLWQTQPDAAFFALDTCQAAWSAKFLNPIKLRETRDENARARFANNLANAEIIGVAKYLREQIRLFNSSVSSTPANLPPSPFEILSGMAANDRDLDTALLYESSHAKAALAGAIGSATVTIALAVRDYSLMQTGRLMILGRAYAAGTVAAIAGIAVTAGAQWYIDWRRAAGLWSTIDQATARMKKTGTPEPWALDNFYTAVTNLGYQYSYDTYLNNSGVDAHPHVNEECRQPLDNYFTQPGLSFAWRMTDHSPCADAVMVWVAASNYLTSYYPRSLEARQVADRLLTLAKRTYLSYKESEAFDRTHPAPLPPCDPFFPLNQQAACVI